MTTKTERFWRWAEEQLQQRGLTWYAVEREAGLSNAAISRRARELLPPTFETCVAIAHVFDLPEEGVLREAGLLRPKPGDDSQFEQARHYFNQLSEVEKDIVLAQMRALVEMKERRKREQGRRGLEPGLTACVSGIRDDATDIHVIHLSSLFWSLFWSPSLGIIRVTERRGSRTHPQAGASGDDRHTDGRGQALRARACRDRGKVRNRRLGGGDDRRDNHVVAPS
jgi:transcriptional regulator with XRE-family HTH domain